jgi:hypothetical protein
MVGNGHDGGVYVVRWNSVCVREFVGGSNVDGVGVGDDSDAGVLV